MATETSLILQCNVLYTWAAACYPLSLVSGLGDRSVLNTWTASQNSLSVLVILCPRSLHRVRAVYGPRKRIISILSYHTQPGRSGAPRHSVNNSRSVSLPSNEQLLRSACLKLKCQDLYCIFIIRKNAWLYGERVEKIYKERGVLWWIGYMFLSIDQWQCFTWDRIKDAK